MIRILHTSDWHLGKTVYGKSMLPDQEYFIEEIFFPLVRRERPDCVLLAGDIYDRQIAPVEAIRLFDRVISELSRERIPLVAITGNHDGADRVAVGTSLLEQQGVILANRLEKEIRPVILEREGRRIHIYPLPYFEPEQARALYPDQKIGQMQDAYAAVLQGIRENMDPSALHILVAHCFIAGCTLSDSENPLSVGGSAQVAGNLLDGFDYVALGHLHAPQRAGKKGRYSGSPLKYSFDESHHKKSMVMLEIGEEISMHVIPVIPHRDMRRIQGTFQELVEIGKRNPSEDYLFATLTDRTPVYLPMEQLRVYYPNLLGLRSEWMTMGDSSVESSDGRGFQKRQSDEEIFDAFMRQICEIEPTLEDENSFQSAREREEKGETV